ncbi:protoglobin domain-containing protein [Herpetosiphon llansteffanensis]|uniref:protoglobin domain-containing protein n=1 Tax=Herpetosiphon llansteffanensis TaxID=2094568 RepID=UPI000D7D0ADE|nr:protoglobin domain-containing protein [Herpetosiphon llansteffanensis]
MPSTASIPGYTYGSAEVAESPFHLADLAILKQTLLFTEADVHYLRMAGTVLEPQVEAILDVWYGFVGAHPHLVAYFSTTQGVAIPDYLARVRARFAQWIRDTTQREYDQTWLNYQMEIGLRHHTEKKNHTDAAAGAPPIIPLRYMVGFIVPITITIKEFLKAGGHSPEEVEQMYAAWFKAVVLHVTLWLQPYAQPGEF